MCSVAVRQSGVPTVICEPVDEARDGGRRAHDEARDEGEPPRRCGVVLGDAQPRQHRHRGRKRVRPDRRVRQGRMQRMARQAPEEKPHRYLLASTPFSRIQLPCQCCLGHLDEPVGVVGGTVGLEDLPGFVRVLVVELRMKREVRRAGLVARRRRSARARPSSFAFETAGCPASIAYMTASASRRLPGAVQATTHSSVSGLGLAETCRRRRRRRSRPRGRRARPPRERARCCRSSLPSLRARRRRACTRRRSTRARHARARHSSSAVEGMLEQVPPLAHGVESLDQLHVGSFRRVIGRC